MLKKLVSGNQDFPASNTLYCKNLNDKINKKQLKIILFELFVQFGIVEKITIRGGDKFRGQAFVLFQDINSAVNAINSINGINILGKPIQIEYAKTESFIEPKVGAKNTKALGPKLPEKDRLEV